MRRLVPEAWLTHEERIEKASRDIDYRIKRFNRFVFRFNDDSDHFPVEYRNMNEYLTEVKASRAEFNRMAVKYR